LLEFGAVKQLDDTGAVFILLLRRSFHRTVHILYMPGRTLLYTPGIDEAREREGDREGERERERGDEI
jgi:hypothetical protein